MRVWVRDPRGFQRCGQRDGNAGTGAQRRRGGHLPGGERHGSSLVPLHHSGGTGHDRPRLCLHDGLDAQRRDDLGRQLRACGNVDLAHAGGALDGLAAANIVISTSPPTVTEVWADEPAGTYGAGDEFYVEVIFSDAVNVTGTPQLALNDGEVATYVDGSGTKDLDFGYTIPVGQATTDLDYASTTALSLNGGTILDAESGLAATLTLSAPGEPLTCWRRNTSSSTRRRRW